MGAGLLRAVSVGLGVWNGASIGMNYTKKCTLSGRREMLLQADLKSLFWVFFCISLLAVWFGLVLMFFRALGLFVWISIILLLLQNKLLCNKYFVVGWLSYILFHIIVQMVVIIIVLLYCWGYFEFVYFVRRFCRGVSRVRCSLVY